MDFDSDFDFNEFLRRVRNDDELNREFQKKHPFAPGARGRAYRSAVNSRDPESTPSFSAVEREAYVAHYRPVLRIKHNEVVPEFVGEEVMVWKDRIMEQARVLNKCIPAIGRVEVERNAFHPWVGTAWLIDKEVIVTNRHVARKFCKSGYGFAFKNGYPGGLQSARIDFLEEHERDESFDVDVESVLWMPDDDDENYPDIAFLKLKAPVRDLILPERITLSKKAAGEGDVVVTIGYPAEDPNFPDPDLAKKLFQGIYDKKRLAPGEIMKASAIELAHDCTTLGGNSGSAIISLKTGEALGLHFAGAYMKANYAVPAAIVQELLDKVKTRSLPGMIIKESPNKPAHARDRVVAGLPAQQLAPEGKTEITVPLKITVELGNPSGGAVSVTANTQPAAIQKTQRLDMAVATVRGYLMGGSEVLGVRPGYRFDDNGEITDERVIVVEMTQKGMERQKEADATAMLSEYLGISVECRAAVLEELIQESRLDIIEESLPESGLYKDPPHLSLTPIDEVVELAVFHVSPDSGYPNLDAFIGRIDKKLTATMYEWDVNHITEALARKINSKQGMLKMVTQRQGTEEAVEYMKEKLRNRFEHQWASVGKGKLIPRAYHIKVALRDDEELWLSSGNWKVSNQANINPAGEKSTSVGPLRDYNREWHAIIKNKTLAKLFADYINYDFKEAQRVPEVVADTIPEVWLFVPDDGMEEAPSETATYFAPLKIENRKLRIEPLLTPDRNERQQRMFLAAATALIRKAKHSICIQNQSFSLLAENNDAFEGFFAVLKSKQDEGLELRIIFRDMREFYNSNMKTLENLKDFGFNTNNVRVQKRCHTKAIIVDNGKEGAAVLFGSHNLTNTGALFNRDASLLVRDVDVAAYFQKIFDFDWNRAKSGLDVPKKPVKRAANAAEEAPAGYRKVLLSELLNEFL